MMWDEVKPWIYSIIQPLFISVTSLRGVTPIHMTLSQLQNTGKEENSNREVCEQRKQHGADQSEAVRT